MLHLTEVRDMFFLLRVPDFGNIQVLSGLKRGIKVKADTTFNVTTPLLLACCLKTYSEAALCRLCLGQCKQAKES